MIKEENLNYKWKFIQIKDSCELVMGQSPPGSSYNEKGKGMPFLQGKAEFGKIYPHNVKYTTDPKRKTKKGNILISVRAPVGDVNIANINYCIGRGLASLNLKNGDNKYLFYLLNYLKPKIEESGTGSTFKAITKSGLEKIKIPVPPIKAQKKIVEILEKAEKLKEWRVEADQSADDYLESMFLDLFGDPLKNPNDWDIEKLGEVCTKITDGTHHSPHNSENGDFPYITAKNIKKNGIILDNITYISKELHEEIYKRCDPKIGDVLYIKDGVTTGIAVVNDLDYEFSLLSSVALLKLGEKLNPYYLAHLLNSENMYRRIRYDMGGAAITRLTLVKIKKIKIPIPPIELQNQFAQIVQQVATLKSYQTESKQQIDNLFNTLMQKAFKGELVC